MNSLQVFNFQERDIRTVVKDGEPWFVVKDVCEILDISNHKDASSRLNSTMKDEVGITDAIGRLQNTTVISEAGIYKLVFTSRKPEAEKFTDWLATDVIPSIRKHGMYAMDELIDNPDLAIRALTALKEEREKTKLLQSKVEQDQPKVLFAESVASSKDSVLIHDLATILTQNGVKNMGEIKLFRWLRDNGYLCKSGEDYNLPTNRSLQLKVMEIKKTTNINTYGDIKVNRTPKVTQKGCIYFVNKIVNK